MPLLVAPPPTPLPFDVEKIRAEFPILAGTSRGKPLIYLDSAATSQKPDGVIDAISRFYRHGNANIHRGVYQLSEQATLTWDAARAKVARFIGAGAPEEVVFVRGTTEAINLVASAYLATQRLKQPVVLVTEMEHHANIVPWQLAGATTVAIPISDDGALDLDAASRLLATRPALLAVTHVSNVLGTVNPIAELCRTAHAHGVPVLVDGAQAVPHLAVDVAALDCDFYVFSSHKLFGPTGIGVLWARRQLLDAMPPYQGGGDMIDVVTFGGTTFAPAPTRFEAGTPHIAGAIGLAAAIDWLGTLDRVAMAAHEEALREDATGQLSRIAGLRVIGETPGKAPVVAFTLAAAHPHDVASLLDGDGIAVRAGHHCTQPLHQRLGVAATVRASFAPYNSHDEVAALARSVYKVQRMFA
jgi:cysteine desulfurase / selenocysteine lyase